MQPGCIESAQPIDSELDQINRVGNAYDEFCMLFLLNFRFLRHACVKLRTRLLHGLNVRIIVGRLTPLVVLDQ